ncbi:YqiA/YcfP family alpha/beta fold hydrolase [Acinetobacter towneri]|uniref:YqiA/YcfP family alpha/beta fold hydrolase n=1 Tax=Acinetobacter towneri TaxID=202956 RepID=UPI001443C4A7|nr:YqiA/YcfP family alpha/beta fold hydrolase [Acinetobacter towneri]
MNLIYLHGFQSSPLSMKGQLLYAYVQQHRPDIQMHLPDLNAPPLEVLAQLAALIQSLPNVALVGSSLGGFYATQLVAQHHVPAVVINPAMRPWQLFQDLFGDVLPYTVHPNWHLTAQQLDDLADIALPVAQDADKILVLLQQGDEVLDYREAQRYYGAASPSAMMMTEAHGNHAMDDFADKIPMLLQFLSDSLA